MWNDNHDKDDNFTDNKNNNSSNYNDKWQPWQDDNYTHNNNNNQLTSQITFGLEKFYRFYYNLYHNLNDRRYDSHPH